MIPVSSDNKFFLVLIGIHVIAGLICVISGLVAMLSSKLKKNHPKAGQIYFWGMAIVTVTAAALLFMKPPLNFPVLILDIFAFGFALTGKKLAHAVHLTRRLHTICMGMSYILLLTGFYVDEGKNLPFWRQFSQLFFWTFPSVIGIPILLYVLFLHPLNQKKK